VEIYNSTDPADHAASYVRVQESRQMFKFQNNQSISKAPAGHHYSIQFSETRIAGS